MGGDGDHGYHAEGNVGRSCDQLEHQAERKTLCKLVHSDTLIGDGQSPITLQNLLD